MDNSPEAKRTTSELDALIQQARDEGKWLRCGYRSLWFSPDELAAKNAAGNYLNVAQNWDLRDPQKHLDYLRERVRDAEREVAQFERRMSQ